MRLPFLHRLVGLIYRKACRRVEDEYGGWDCVPKRVRKALEIKQQGDG